jgi:hypothetical protein
MPGKMPQRYEFMAFGELVDGKVECISAVYCGKVTCPWELDIVAIAQSSTSKGIEKEERTQSMVNFINALCQENAILPNYLPLERFSALIDINRYLPRSVQFPFFGPVSSGNSADAGIADPMPDNKHWNPSSRSSIVSVPDPSAKATLMDGLADLYTVANRHRPYYICLDHIPQVNLGPYWFRVLIPHPYIDADDEHNLPVPVYFRQKLSGVQGPRGKGIDAQSCSDFEIFFTRPTTGTEGGSGTVGGALILSEERAQEMLPQATKQYFDILRRKVSAKILHPERKDLEALMLLQTPGQVQRPASSTRESNDNNEEKKKFNRPPRHV